MRKMNFTVCLIARNEAKTLPHLMESLKEFQEKGGFVLVLDTGSTDNTVEVAKGLGCIVYEVGNKFLIELSEAEAKAINEKFVVEGDQDIVKAGDKQFDYSSARNYIAQYAITDVVATPDCDEMYTKLDLDKINQAIEDGIDQLEYNFVFSHDQYGNEAIKFMHCKFYNRKKLKWEGIIHEILVGEAKKQFFGEDIIKLEHWQNPETDRGHYLRGLAIDCFRNLNNDRNSHYFGRELVWTGRHKSAIKELERHIAMNKWPTEAAQSMIYIGDAYGGLNIPEKQAEAYSKSFYMDSSRREALIKLSRFYQHNKNYQACSSYAAAALQIPWSSFYGNNMLHYTSEPYELLYWASGWLGDVDKARNALNNCLAYQPLNSQYLRDYRYYNILPKISFVLTHMGKSKERVDGLNRCIKSIENLNYPKELIELIVLEDTLENRKGVPLRVAEGLKKSTGDAIVYASNDTEFTPDSLILAILCYRKNGKGLISFNTGKLLPDEGNINEHFLIFKWAIDRIGGEIFDTDFHHVGVDNLLWARCKRLDLAIRCEEAIVNHYHFTKGAPMDDVYTLGWSQVNEDRLLLKRKLLALERSSKNR